MLLKNETNKDKFYTRDNGVADICAAESGLQEKVTWPQIFSTLNINGIFWLVNLVTINIFKYNKVQIYN